MEGKFYAMELGCQALVFELWKQMLKPGFDGILKLPTDRGDKINHSEI
jgi:hypothetical protein